MLDAVLMMAFSPIWAATLIVAFAITTVPRADGGVGADYGGWVDGGDRLQPQFEHARKYPTSGGVVADAHRHVAYAAARHFFDRADDRQIEHPGSVKRRVGVDETHGPHAVSRHGDDVAHDHAVAARANNNKVVSRHASAEGGYRLEIP